MSARRTATRDSLVRSLRRAPFLALAALLPLLPSPVESFEPVEVAVIVNPEIPRELFLVRAEKAEVFMRGDVNADGNIDMNDAILLAAFIKNYISEVPCADAGDVNDDGYLDDCDLYRIIIEVHLEYYEPLFSYECERDLTEDNLLCAETTCS